jgi:hypothetical protein
VDDKPTKSPALSYPETLIVKLIRAPIVIAIVLNVVGASLTHPLVLLLRIASLILAAVFIVLAGFVCTYVLIPQQRRRFSHHGGVTLTLAFFALPFLGVRVLYLVLGSFQVENGRFNALFGDVAIDAGMALCMEVLVVGLLCAARVVILPLRMSKDKRPVV